MIKEVVKSGDIGWGIYKYYFPCKVIKMWRTNTDICIRLNQKVLKLYEGTKDNISNRYTAQVQELRNLGLPEYLCKFHKVYLDKDRECTIILPDFIVQEKGLKIDSEYPGYINKIEHKNKFFYAATQVIYIKNDFEKCYIKLNYNELTNNVLLKVDDFQINLDFEFDGNDSLNKLIHFKTEDDIVNFFKLLKDLVPGTNFPKLNFILSKNYKIIKNYYPEYVWSETLLENNEEEVLSLHTLTETV